jgi:hypothetical protein
MSETLCECWTGPARLHTGHCCMREPLPAVCHVEEGRAAWQAANK